MEESSASGLFLPFSPGLHLISGGARSGKSRFAVELAQQKGMKRLFIATSQAWDDEMQERIRLHKIERQNLFHTLEVPLFLDQALESQALYDVILIDCLTLWISNLLFHELSDYAIQMQIKRGLEAALLKSRHVILVSNEVGFGIVPEHALSRRFRDLNGRLQQDIGAAAQEIHLAALGVILPLKRLAQLAASHE